MQVLKIILMALAFISLQAHAKDGRNLTVGQVNDMVSEKRIALVIGNSKYSEKPLSNTANDARDMAAALRELGFDVTAKIDVTQKEMNRAIAQFGGKLNANTIALFYYAGHGMQVKGKNYLIPVDAQIAAETSVRAETVDVDTVLDQLNRSPLSLVILDACRNNPFERRFRSTGGGLAAMDAPKGTLIAYATSPGSVASDGTGRNGLYTKELLKAMRTPGLPVERMFKEVRKHVASASGDTQIPWEMSSLTGEFYFKPGTQATSPETVPVREDNETALWAEVQKGDNKDDYNAYLAQYPKGKYAALAKSRIKKQEFLIARKTAEQGDADAQFNIGAMYDTGEGIAKDEAEALKWYQKAAAQGHAGAQSSLGYMYATGEGVQKDAAKAVEWYQKAAAQGNADAQVRLGGMYYFGDGVPKDAAKAVEWWQKSAAQRNAIAQLFLGVMYATGEGVRKDAAKAAEWYQKAAAQGNADAQFKIGVMYAFGKGVAKDEVEAVKWVRKAAEQGHADAQFNLGVRYDTGYGVAKDEVEAVKWYRKAAEQGDADAQFALGSAYAFGDGVAKDEAEAVKWSRKAAEQGHAGAQYLVGWAYHAGEGVAKDEAEAAKWFRKAAKQGNADAISQLKKDRR